MPDCPDFLLEAVLTALVVGIWLGPFLLGIKRKAAVTIHPAGALPAFNVIVVLVAMSEHWFGWTHRGPTPGIRLETAYLQSDPYFFATPLFFFALMGVFYHLGVWMTLGRIAPCKTDRFHLDEPLPLARNINGRRLFWTAAVTTVVCVVPFICFGQESGFFWTVTLLMGIDMIPVALSYYSLRAGIASTLLLAPLMFLFPSKQNFFYFLLPYALMRQGHLLGRGRISVGGLLAVGGGIMAVYLGTWTLIEMRDEVHEGESIGEYVLVREYGFETFSILVNKAQPFPTPGLPVWLASEVLEFIPQALVPFPKPRTGILVALAVMPRDAAYMAEAGFYKGFAFSAYIDYGLPGALLWSLLFGALFGSAYRKAQAASLKHRAIWPLLVYLPLPLFSQFWAEGGLAFGGLFAISLALVPFMLIRLSSRDAGPPPTLSIPAVQEEPA